MKYVITTGYEYPKAGKPIPIIIEFSSGDEANKFIQTYLETEHYGFVGVETIINDTIYLYTGYIE
jgi:hypothetical protein